MTGKIITQKCSGCKSEMVQAQYFDINKKGAYKKTCRECLRKQKERRSVAGAKEYYKQWRKEHYEKNREKILQQSKDWYEANRDRKAETQKKWAGENKERVLKNQRNWKAKKYAEDPEYRLRNNLGSRMSKLVSGVEKSASTMTLVGCTIDELKDHLEKQFTDGMSWNNYGSWHVDHRRPCCSYDLLDPEQQLKCFHYSNLQPLWAIDNLKKGGRWG